MIILISNSQDYIKKIEKEIHRSNEDMNFELLIIFCIYYFYYIILL